MSFLDRLLGRGQPSAIPQSEMRIAMPPIVLARSTDRSFQIAPDGTVSLSGTWDARFLRGMLDVQIAAQGRERGRRALAWQRENGRWGARGRFTSQSKLVAGDTPE